VLVATAALVGLSATSGCTKNGEAWRSFQLINQERAAAGVAPLDLDAALVEKAQAWAETMAAEGRWRHSNLLDGVTPGWRYVAENVGAAGNVDEVHFYLMRSPSHRANVLDRRSNRVGTGAAVADGRVFIVQVFAGY
jgi:uncharacterized protein YkwD